jgi:hypothetical protein
MIIALTSCTKCPKAIRSEKECQSNSQVSMSQSVTVGEPTTTIRTVGVTAPQFAKNHTTTNTTTITDAIATKMNTTTTQMMSILTDSIIESIVYPIETEVVTKTEPIIVEPVTKIEPLNGYWDGTYYAATSMGYTYQPCGASGNQLISGYSVASDYFPFGTLLYIESDYMNGTFRVDDCGVGNYNTIDFYFYDNSEIPVGFLNAGRVPITITVIE